MRRGSSSPEYDALVGRRFVRLVVVSEAAKRGKRRQFHCICDCGTPRLVDATNLLRGISKSCGCARREKMAARNTSHGLARRQRVSPEYISWCAMKGRCSDAQRPDFHDYGGRGITVCDRWLHDFPAFLADMGPRPSPKHSIDRIDVNGNYEPGNCRWATVATQRRNTRATRYLTIDGITRPLAAWAEEVGISPRTVKSRINQLGWSPERAVRTPVK